MDNTNLIQFILRILSGTPTWAWFVLGYLLFVGIKAINSRVIYLPKLFITPLIFAAIKYKTLLNATISIWIYYLTCLLISVLLSYKFASKQKLEIAQGNLQIKLSGSYSTLIILMSFFIIQYIFGYLYATNQNLYSELTIFEISVSGIFSGYFLGKSLSYLNRYMKLK